MQRPETKEDVKRALGLINYLSRFIPHQSANNKALRSLLKEDTAWEWSTQHEHEWNEIKTVLTNKPLLVYFDPQKQIKISSAGADPGGGVQGSKDPPGPQRGGPGPLFQNEENSIYYLQFYLIPPNKSL